MLSSIDVNGRPIQDRWYQERYGHITCSLSPKKKGGRRASRAGNIRLEYAKDAVRKRDTEIEHHLKLTSNNEASVDVEAVMHEIANGRQLTPDEVEHVRVRFEDHEPAAALGLWYSLEHPESLRTEKVVEVVEIAAKHYPPKLSIVDITSVMRVLNDREPPTSEEVSYIIQQLQSKGLTEPFPKSEVLPLLHIWYVSCALHEDQKAAHCCLDDNGCALL
eukprot:TRINITY_DN7678_c0_g1_i1.p1 TRINITY_DN7678_c0_g1~~TRINITY_DN7678_c0_g1_i1.p1  ORF type:complete len:219 (+),score=27.61 TRINITY_DN7678_c0_g1_i1:168-824(+)